jgi:hypothetical protein
VGGVYYYDGQVRVRIREGEGARKGEETQTWEFSEKDILKEKVAEAEAEAPAKAEAKAERGRTDLKDREKGREKRSLQRTKM